MSSYSAIVSDLQALKNPEKAKILQRFFKTGKGQYGEGDIFLGIVVPKQREVMKKHWKEATLEDVERLLASPVHEYRLGALFILTEKYKHAKSEDERQAIFDFYLAHTKFINNWDLVDLSAAAIVGGYLHGQGPQEWKKVLLALAKSKNLWERRIAMLGTFYSTGQGEYEPVLCISEMLLQDRHDLIHKASGWMLREMGKRGGIKELRAFLDKHAEKMPRTMLQYAIERMEEKERKHYLARGR